MNDALSVTFVKADISDRNGTSFTTMWSFTRFLLPCFDKESCDIGPRLLVKGRETLDNE